MSATKNATSQPDPSTFRDVLGNLPTGVTIVTANAADGPVGMACNSFTSVSLDPPLVSFCPAKSSATWPDIRSAGRFCVNVMASEHEHVCRHFSRKDVDRFADVVHSERPGGPGLEEAIAWIDCEIRDEHEAGDHVIVVGAVVGIEARGDREPLVFFRGEYGSFTPVGEQPEALSAAGE